MNALMESMVEAGSQAAENPKLEKNLSMSVKPSTKQRGTQQIYDKLTQLETLNVSLDVGIRCY